MRQYEEEQEIVAAPIIQAAPAAKSFAPPPLHPHREPASDVPTWPITSVDTSTSNRKKASRKKGTLGIGNGALFFASESDKTPVQQVSLSLLTGSEFDLKNKSIELSFSDGTSFLFEAKSKDVVTEIEAKLADVAPTSPPAGKTQSTNAADGGKLAIVQYDFSGDGEDELSVAENERVIVLNSSDADWWMVQREGNANEQGVVPATYLEVPSFPKLV